MTGLRAAAAVASGDLLSGGAPYLTAVALPALTLCNNAPLHAPVAFGLRRGEALCLRGASGAGKSTLLATLALLTTRPPPRALQLFGRDAAGLNDAAAAQLRRQHMAVMLQRGNLVPQLSVADNVTLVARLAGRAVDAGRLQEVLLALDLLALAHRRARLLSGGEAGRAAVARLVYCAPPLVLADEPTAGQDAQRAALVVEALLALRRGGSALVVATHDADVADALGPSLWLAATASTPSAPGVVR